MTTGIIAIEETEKGKIWKEIVNIVNSTHLTETDKEIFLDLINKYCDDN